MNQIVRKVMLFTLSACVLGRSMNSVLGEVRSLHYWMEEANVTDNCLKKFCN